MLEYQLRLDSEGFLNPPPMIPLFMRSKPETGRGGQSWGQLEQRFHLRRVWEQVLSSGN